MEDLVVWFSFVFSCDKDPEDVIGRIRPEWRKNGGDRLQLKDLETHNPRGAVVLYKMHNQGQENAILVEVDTILRISRDEEAVENRDDFKWEGVDIPVMHLSLKVPHIPGQDTSMLDRMSNRMKAERKAFHITCDAGDVKQVHYLMEIAKRRNQVGPYWGPNVSLSNVIISKKIKRHEEKTPFWQINAIRSFTKNHVNYHESTTTKGFAGLYDIDKTIVCYENEE